MSFETDVENIVDEALDLEEFDVLDFVSGGALPTKTIKFYTNAAAAFELAEIIDHEKAVAESETWSLADENDVDEERVGELREALEASALTFELRGLAPAAILAIEASLRAKHEYKEGDDNEAYNEAFNLQLVSDSIQSVTNAAGAKGKKLTPAAVRKLNGSAHPGEWAKLFGKVFELSYSYNIFDKAVSADF